MRCSHQISWVASINSDLRKKSACKNYGKVRRQPINFPFDNSYARLPEEFFSPAKPAGVAAPRLLLFNEALADQLGIERDGATDDELAQVFSGQRLVEGSQPLAQAYAGHQFGQFVPQLGDGRAILLGEVVNRQGRRFDLQLKGAGRTLFSRGGDGLAPIGPVLREFLVSEAMYALGVPTTRALAAVATGATVERERPLPGAILTRVAASHLRIGTVQLFAARGNRQALNTLVEYTLQRHYPDHPIDPTPAMTLLQAVCEQQARLVARWMALGFIHGVMNTDNMTLSGETIDYGPCAFMDQYDPQTRFSSIDHGGRYAYGNQPIIAQWNLARLAEALLPTETKPNASLEQAKAIIEQFMPRYEQLWLEAFNAKLGLAEVIEGDRQRLEHLHTLMQAGTADFTQTFRGLARWLQTEELAALPAGLQQQPELPAWLADWQQRLTRQGRTSTAVAQAMNRVNPYVIPRNHKVEAVLTAAEQGNLTPFKQMLAAVRRPYEEGPEQAEFSTPAPLTERVYQTFCGT
nr:YdiU family protein [Desulfurivibrio alkaliphilus]